MSAGAVRCSGMRGLGRPVLYGLALGGSQGVKSVYDRIAAELGRAMTIAGVSAVSEIKEKIILDS